MINKCALADNLLILIFPKYWKSKAFYLFYAKTSLKACLRGISDYNYFYFLLLFRFID